MRCSADLAFALALALAAPAVGAQERCGSCHAGLREPRLRGPAEQVAASVHAAPQVGCSSCHGGRANESTASAHDPAAGFVARPSPAEVADRCGGCHADARFVRRTNDALPTDQLALFRAAPHGRAVAANRADAPSCASCHGAHDILPTRDLRSPVHDSRVATTCGRCHENAPRAPGHAAEPPSAWRGSVHGRALLDRHDPGAPACADCHGAHGEYQESGGPGGRCGACHADEAAAFARSPHAQPFARLGFSGCVRCHGSHGVSEVDGALLGGGASSVCARCHGGSQRSFETAGRLAAARAGALRAVDDAEDELRRADAAGFTVPEAGARLEAARAAQRRLDVELHTLDEAAAREAAAAVTGAACEARAAVRRALSRRDRQRRAWAPVAALFLVLGALLALRARTGDPR